MKLVYEVITTKDSYAFKLKTPPIQYEGDCPSLTVLQNAVGGEHSNTMKTKRNLIEYMPRVFLMHGLKEMIVHEEGLLIDLEGNELATQLLNGYAVVGDVVVVTENGIGKCIEQEEELIQTMGAI